MNLTPSKLTPSKVERIMQRPSFPDEVREMMPNDIGAAREEAAVLAECATMLRSKVQALCAARELAIMEGQYADAIEAAGIAKAMCEQAEAASAEVDRLKAEVRRLRAAPAMAVSSGD